MSLFLFNIQDMEALVKEKDMLQQDKEALEGEKLSLTKTVGNLRKDVRERDYQVNILCLAYTINLTDFSSMHGNFYPPDVYHSL